MPSIHSCVRAVNVLSLILIGCIANAQTVQTSTPSFVPPLMSAGFPKPSQPIDWRRYDMPQQCAHAIVRVADSASGRTVDSMPHLYTDTQPTAVIQQARRCLTQFPWTTTTPKRDWHVEFRFTVLAGNDAQVHSAVARILDTLPAKAIAARMNILANAVSVLMQARPARIALARTFITQGDSLASGSAADVAVFDEITMMHKAAITEPAELAHDLDTQEHEAEFALSLWAKMRDTADLGVKVRKLGAALELRRVSFLRTGSESELTQFVTADSLGLDIVAKMLGTKNIIGMVAPPLLGDFWYGRRPGPSFPIDPGTVSLIVFKDEVGESVFNYKYIQLARELRRLQDRFPALRIVLMTATTRVFGNKVLPTTQAAADSVHRYLAEVYRIPGILSVSNIPTFTLASPDLRVIRFRPDSNSQYPHAWKSFLVDARGRVVDAEYSDFTEKDAVADASFTDFLQRILSVHSAP